jgi:glycosyltransferase involved in cell wall biosynthesis
MRIGVVTPAYNVAPLIGDAIASVLAQTHVDWRMIVVDDGSHDHTSQTVCRFVDRRVTLIRQPHLGVSAARNRGMQALETDALLFLDADDQLAPDAMAVLAHALEESPWAAAAVGSYTRMRAGQSEALGRTQCPPEGELLGRMLIRNPFANGGHLLIRYDAAAAAGPFRTDLIYGEDWEYWIRIALQGEFVRARDPRPLCFVRERPGSAYRTMASDPASFAPCMQVIFTNPDLLARLGMPRLMEARRRAEAENAWVIGRELIRHGLAAAGRVWLRRSVASWPSVRRIALLTAASWVGWLPETCRGPFRPYP